MTIQHDHHNDARKDKILEENYEVWIMTYTAQKMKFSIEDFFSKCDQIHRKLRIWSHLLTKSFIQKLYFLCSVSFT